MIVNCEYLSNKITDLGITTGRFYQKYDIISLRLGPVIRTFLGKKTYNLNSNLFLQSEDTMIVFDGGICDRAALEGLLQNKNVKRFIFYYWNPVAVSLDPRKIPKQYEIWSYSPEDCKKYGFQYNSTFYIEHFSTTPKSEAENDIFFIGKDKGRYETLMKYKHSFDECGYKTDFYITATHPKIDRSKPRQLSYQKSFERTMQSKCIFDYYMDPTAGLSLRAMESIFYSKKLITNNITVVNYDFYNANNIFVVNGPDFKKEDLKEFMNQEYAELSCETIDYYKFKNWLKRFEK